MTHAINRRQKPAWRRNRKEGFPQARLLRRQADKPGSPVSRGLGEKAEARFLRRAFRLRPRQGIKK